MSVVILSYQLVQAITDLIAGVQSVGDGVLVDVKSCQSEGHLVLQLRGEPLLDDVIAALDVEVLERHRVRPQQLVGVRGDEGDAEQTAEVVSPRAGGNLEQGNRSLTGTAQQKI